MTNKNPSPIQQYWRIQKQKERQRKAQSKAMFTTLDIKKIKETFNQEA